jgi:protein MAK16
MMKTIERAHTPRKMWEKVKLSRQYLTALGQLDKHLEFWPAFLVHKNKQRLTKITQYLLRCRKLAKQVRPELLTMPAKLEKREARREVKAQVAARLEASIEAELLARLQSGTYNEIYNFPSKEYAKVLGAHAERDAVEGEPDEEEELEEEEEGEEVEFVEGYEDLDASDEEQEDMEDAFGDQRAAERFGGPFEQPQQTGARGAKRKAVRRPPGGEREMEFEREEDAQPSRRRG